MSCKLCILQLTEHYLATLQERDALQQQVSQVTDQTSTSIDWYFIMIRALDSDWNNNGMMDTRCMQLKVMERYFWLTFTRVLTAYTKWLPGALWDWSLSITCEVGIIASAQSTGSSTRVRLTTWGSSYLPHTIEDVGSCSLHLPKISLGKIF